MAAVHGDVLTHGEEAQPGAWHDAMILSRQNPSHARRQELAVLLFITILICF